MLFSWQIVFSLFLPVRDVILVHNKLKLIDKLVDINYSKKRLEWAETVPDSDSDCELLT